MRDNINIQFLAQSLLEDIDETSTSSGVGTYQVKPGKDTYKKGPGERTTGGEIYKDLWEVQEGDKVKISDKVQMGGETGTIDQVRGGFVVVKMDSDGGKYSFHSSDVEKVDSEEELDEVFTKDEYKKIEDLINSIKDKDPQLYDKLQNTKLWAAMDPYDTKTYDDFSAMVPDELKENYSRFKNETKTRSKSDQFHQAIREVKKKVQEIHKVFEYVNRLKEELNEGEQGLKYKKHTEAAMSKIKEMVSELNVKIKKFK